MSKGERKMLFNSLRFLLFFPIAVFSYYIVPKKVQNIWLLILNYFFYMQWNAKYGLLLMGCTVITYFAGIAIFNAKNNGSESKRGRYYLTIALIAIFGVLCVYKYTNFIIGNANAILSRLGVPKEIPHADIVLPVGISFFTFQAAGYLIDVFKGVIPCERNFVDFALFISFFPQLLSGPIARGKQLICQFKENRKFNYDKAKEGILLMLWGYFLKLVIADRCAMLVNQVYGDFYSYTGAQIIFATIIYAVQIYCDFYGYSTLAVGTAKILGVDLIDNFECPYYSQSVQEFWRRWHISLSTWLRDYIYFPLGGSRCSKKRAAINLMITFLVSGLWHGSKWSFVAWGCLNGLYQIVGKYTRESRNKFIQKVGINSETGAFKLFQMIITFVFIDFSWLFFRADGFMNALRMGKRMLLQLHPLSIYGDAIYNLGLNEKNFRLLIQAVIVLAIADIFKYKNVSVSQWVLKQNWLFRVLLISLSTILILLVGIWGNAYNASSFIYFQF